MKNKKKVKKAADKLIKETKKSAKKEEKVHEKIVKAEKKAIAKDEKKKKKKAKALAKANKIKKLMFVKFNVASETEEMYNEFHKEVFGEKGENLLIFLGEVKNAKGHCVLADLKTGKVLGMYHTANFRKATEEEV